LLDDCLLIDSGAVSNTVGEVLLVLDLLDLLAIVPVLALEVCLAKESIVLDLGDVFAVRIDDRVTRSITMLIRHK